MFSSPSSAAAHHISVAKAGLGSALRLVKSMFPMGLSGHPGLEISSTLLFSTFAALEFVESLSLHVFYGLCGEI